MCSAPSLPPSCYASSTVWAVGWVSARIWIKISFLFPLLDCWHVMHLCRPLHQHPQGPYQVAVAVTWSSWSWRCRWKKCSCSHGIPPLCLFSLMVKWEQLDFSVYRSGLRVNVSNQQLSTRKLPPEKAQDVPIWDGEGSGYFHVTSSTSHLPHPLWGFAALPFHPQEHSLCVPCAKELKKIGTGVNFVGTWRAGLQCEWYLWVIQHGYTSGG